VLGASRAFERCVEAHRSPASDRTWMCGPVVTPWTDTCELFADEVIARARKVTRTAQLCGSLALRVTRARPKGELMFLTRSRTKTLDPAFEARGNDKE